MGYSSSLCEEYKNGPSTDSGPQDAHSLQNIYHVLNQYMGIRKLKEAK